MGVSVQLEIHVPFLELSGDVNFWSWSIYVCECSVGCYEALWGLHFTRYWVPSKKGVTVTFFRFHFTLPVQISLRIFAGTMPAVLYNVLISVDLMHSVTFGRSHLGFHRIFGSESIMTKRAGVSCCKKLMANVAVNRMVQFAPNGVKKCKVITVIYM